MKKLPLVIVSLLTGCGPVFAPGWYPVIDDKGRVVMGVDHPDTARRNGLADRTVVTCSMSGWDMHTTIGSLDRLVSDKSGMVCRPYEKRTDG